MTLSRTIHRCRKFAQLAAVEICGDLRKSADASCVCMTLSRTIHRWRRFAQMAPVEICGDLRHLRMHLVFAIYVSV